MVGTVTPGKQGGEMPKCLVFLETPYWIDYDHQPFERQTHNYPGCQESITINDVEIADDLKEYISEKYEDQIIDECWEDYRENQRGRY